MAILAACSAMAQTAGTPATMNQGAVILQDFQQRVGDYMKLHQTVQSEVHRLALHSRRERHISRGHSAAVLTAHVAGESAPAAIT
jgi:hypothetical protein